MEIYKMTKSFIECVKNCGKVVTKELKNNRFMNVCYDKEGSSYIGDVKTRKKKEFTKRPASKTKSNVKKSLREIAKNAKVTLADLKRLKAHFDSKCC